MISFLVTFKCKCIEAPLHKTIIFVDRVSKTIKNNQ